MIVNAEKLVKAPFRALGYVLGHVCKTEARKVVLVCNHGRAYADNPKYIVEELEREHPGEFDFVLLVKDGAIAAPPYVRKVADRGLRALWELSTARIWLDNARWEKYPYKRCDQTYIQTWHGYIGPKKIEKDAEDKLPAEYVRKSKRDGAQTDLMFANNNLYEKVFNSSFWFDGPVIRCGMPRNRFLSEDPSLRRKRVFECYGIDRGKALCVYAPTFRQGDSLSAYQIDFERVRKALKRRFKRDFVMAYRLHPNIAKESRTSTFETAVDMTGYGDPQDIVAACDVMISDYSSILDDFALTGRPGFALASDIEAYAEERGLYYPIEIRPAPIAKDCEALCEAIASFSEEDFKRRSKEYFDFLGLCEDGKGDKVLAGIIYEIAVNGRQLADVIG